jgi:hypothetical protein
MERFGTLLLTTLFFPLFLNAQIASHEVSERFEMPFRNGYDLAWDGQDLWISHDEGRIARVDPRSGRIIGRMDTELGELKGLTYDGEALWAAETKDESIHRVELQGGRSSEEHPSPAQGLSRPSGLAWDGEKFWNNDTRTVYCGSEDQDATLRFEPGEGSEKSFGGVGDCPFGLTFGAGHLWVGENGSHRIYMVDTSDGSVVDSLEAPSPFVNGLSYSEGGLWMMSNREEGPELLRIEMELAEEEKEEKEFVKVNSEGDFFYPNPADNFLRMDLPKDVPKGKKRLELYGAKGERILIRTVRSRNERIELPELSNGIHHLRILIHGKLWRSSSLLIAQ